LSQPRQLAHRAPPAGRNIGKLISSVSFSKQTSTGMSQRICLGSGAMPTRLLRSRGPSSSSTIASTTGVFTLNALFRIWCAISNEKSRPRPDACTQPMSREAQNGHDTGGSRNAFPHARHLVIMSLPSRAPSQYGRHSGVIGVGSGRSRSMGGDSNASWGKVPPREETTHGAEAGRSKGPARDRRGRGSPLPLGPASSGAGTYAGGFRGAGRLPASARLSSGPRASGAGAVGPRRDPRLRPVQHPLSLGHGDRRVGTRQADALVPLDGQRRAVGVGLRLCRAPP